MQEFVSSTQREIEGTVSPDHQIVFQRSTELNQGFLWDSLSEKFYYLVVPGAFKNMFYACFNEKAS